MSRRSLAWYAWVLLGWSLAWLVGLAAAVARYPVPEATIVGFLFGVAYVSTTPAILRAIARRIR